MHYQPHEHPADEEVRIIKILKNNERFGTTTSFYTSSDKEQSMEGRYEQFWAIRNLRIRRLIEWNYDEGRYRLTEHGEELYAWI